MPSDSTDTTFKHSEITDDGVLVAKRRKTGKFVEYQPSNGSLKKVHSGKKPSTASRKNISCAECRRLKLKCDRVFPCRACVRRGCQGICPNGSLVSGKGTRYVLASTEKLHEKISEMSERILELEDALRALYEEHRICLTRSRNHCGPSHNPPPTHPLLVDGKLLVKNHIELYREEHEQESSPILTHSTRNNEQTCGYLAQGCQEQEEDRIVHHDADQDVQISQIPVDVPEAAEKQDAVVSYSTISRLATAFWPIWRKISQGLPISDEVKDMQLQNSDLQLLKSELLEALPSREETERLSCISRDSGFFISNYVLTSPDLDGIMSDVYDRSIADTSMVSAALLFILVGIGLHMDYSSSGREYDQTVDEAVENYVSRSRAAMALHATEEDVCASPSLELRAIQYHFLFMFTLVVVSLRGQETRRKTDAMDILVSLVKNGNLHEEISYSKFSEEGQNDRRFLLYETLSIVGEMCLAQDLPMPLNSIDVEQPHSDGKDTRRFPSEVEEEYHNRRRDFYVNCMRPVLGLRSIPPSDILYSDILELDCKIRTFPFPTAVLQEYDAEPTGISGAKFSMRRLKLLRFINTYRVNTLLLHLHRRFMQQCLNTQASVLAHPYFASVVASCRSAWIIIRNTDAMHQTYPELVNRLGLPWYNVLCAATANFILLERVPYCPLAPYCLRELNRAADVIERASDTRSEIAGRAAPIVRQFVARAPESLRRWKEALDAVLEANTRLHARADFCDARFKAMITRIKRAGLPTRDISAIAPLSRTSDPISDGLDIWDIAHPEIGEVLTMLPGCVIDQRISDEALWETVRTPLNKSNTDGNAQTAGATRTPLMEFFDALDNRLRQRPDFIISTPPNEPDAGAPDVTSALRDMFPDDIDLDWATLTDALVSAPQELMRDMQNASWTGQWGQWERRDSPVS